MMTPVKKIQPFRFEVIDFKFQTRQHYHVNKSTHLHVIIIIHWLSLGGEQAPSPMFCRWQVSAAVGGTNCYHADQALRTARCPTSFFCAEYHLISVADWIGLPRVLEYSLVVTFYFRLKISVSGCSFCSHAIDELLEFIETWGFRFHLSVASGP